MQDYSEKRDFPRMVLDCSARYRPERGGEPLAAIAHDLSGGGLLLKVKAHETPDLGSRLLVEVRPEHQITPPLYMRARVVRCEPRDDGGYGLACAIEKTFGEDDIPAGFT